MRKDDICKIDMTVYKYSPKQRLKNVPSNHIIFVPEK